MEANAASGDHSREEENQAKEKKADQHECPSCGGAMVFDPAAGMLSCPYCGKQIAVDTGAEQIEEHDFNPNTDAAKADWGVETAVIRCKNCGAELTIHASDAADFCAFCGSPMVVRAEQNCPIVPEAVLPFHITQDTAVKSFRSWIRSRFFSPGKLKREHQIGKLRGVYIPHFTYDCRTFSSYTAEAGTYYYVEEPVWVEENGKRVQRMQTVRKVSWRPVSGSYDNSYDDLLVNASSHVDRKLIGLHFNLHDLKPYSPDYVYGFLAENYSIDEKMCWNDAKAQIDRDLASRITRQIAADEVRNLNVASDYFDTKFKEVLLPVWISVYTYKKKTYKFMINGETGEVKGQAPLSASRILLSILVTLGLPAAVYPFSPTASVIVFMAAALTLLILACRKPKEKPAK